MTRNEIQVLFNQHDNLVKLIEDAVKTRLSELGNKQASDILQMEKSTISMFIHDARKFSIKNLKNISDKIFEKS